MRQIKNSKSNIILGGGRRASIGMAIFRFGSGFDLFGSELEFKPEFFNSGPGRAQPEKI